jgi:hypothetical protein
MFHPVARLHQHHSRSKFVHRGTARRPPWGKCTTLCHRNNPSWTIYIDHCSISHHLWAAHYKHLSSVTQEMVWQVLPEQLPQEETCRLNNRGTADPGLRTPRWAAERAAAVNSKKSERMVEDAGWTRRAKRWTESEQAAVKTRYLHVAIIPSQSRTQHGPVSFLVSNAGAEFSLLATRRTRSPHLDEAPADYCFRCRRP